MKVLVTGAGGQLGSAIVRAFADAHEVIALARRDLDIASHQHVQNAVMAARPGAIINCVAYNDVDGAEDDPLAALDANAFGVRSLARAAAEVDATLVHYSTDFVFDGESDHPYVETTLPNPKSLYASSKLLGEWFAREVPRHYVLRVASLFGPPGTGHQRKSSVDRIIDAIDGGQEAPVFVDRIVSPGYVVDVAAATFTLLSTTPAPGLYHCVNSGYATWYELGQFSAELLGRAPRLRPVSVADVKLRASRPKFAALSNAKLAAAGIPMPTWQDALARHVASRVKPSL